MNSVCLPASPDYVCAARKAMPPKGGAAIAAARNGTAEGNFQVEVGVGEKRILRKNVGGKGGQSNVVMRFL